MTANKKDLVIVESPAKARTIGRFLGSKYVAMASMGHVRDLPTGEMGVDVDGGGFHPTYRVLDNKKKVVGELIRASREANMVYLATDPDREGEAISWHLIQAARIDPAKARRVVFHQITREAIREAFEHPRDLDQHLIDAQQARRILDRLVGYRLSPVLWRKVRRGLSAGRVQSVALRLIVDRERQVLAFEPVEYWTVDALLARASGGPTFKAGLHAIEGRKGRLVIANEAEAGQITSDLEGGTYRVASVRTRPTRVRPMAPFTTSTLQQEASRRLRFTARRTMAVAQQLYEGLALGDEGSVGLITYMRTDSTTVAPEALRETAEYIRARFGPEYSLKSPRVYKRKAKGAQEAHEAVRPTSIRREPQTVRPFLTPEQLRLYDLVWKRMVASQMPDAVFDSTTVEVEAESRVSDTRYAFRATGSVLKFPGHRALSAEDRARDDDGGEAESAPLPELTAGESLRCAELKSDQHFTEPPPRYGEATLIKSLEEEGIGRPSTYAPTIATILDRDYARRESGRLAPTKLGIAVSDLLTRHFPDIIEVGFTARVEEELDEIARGERPWRPVLQRFYEPFNQAIEKALVEAQRVPREQIDEESDETCEVCERPMVIKSGRFGRFLSCSGFPECRTARPLLARVGVDCPECGGAMVERRQRGKGGRRFFGCSNYPACNFVVNQRPLPHPCPECGKMLVAYGRSQARCTACAYKGPAPDDSRVEMAV